MHRQDLRVDPEEAQEIVRLAADRQASAPQEGPTVAGLAEALNLSPSEIERLLEEVRSRRAAPASQRRTFGDRSAALSAGLALLLVIAASGLGFTLLRMRKHESPPVFAISGTTEGFPNGEIVAETVPDVIPSVPAPSIPTDPIVTDNHPNTEVQKLELLEKKVEELARKRAEITSLNVDEQLRQLDAELDRLKEEEKALRSKVSR